MDDEQCVSWLDVAAITFSFGSCPWHLFCSQIA